MSELLENSTFHRVEYKSLNHPGLPLSVLRMTASIDTGDIFNLQSNVSHGKFHQGVDFAFYFENFIQLSQQ